MELALSLAMPITSFHDLEAWRLAMGLAEQVYAITSGYPVAERYGLVAQTRRAAVSVAANIAEGHARPCGAYINHLSIALGSHAELETLLLLAHRLGYVDWARLTEGVDAIRATGRCLQALHSALRRSKRGR